MYTRTVVPFDRGLFYSAMVGLLGREPDERQRFGDDGMYNYCYEPKDKAEGKKFAEHAATLQRWLSIFELTPMLTRCEYGRLLRPQKGEEGKDYLYITIVHPVEKRQEC